MAATNTTNTDAPKPTPLDEVAARRSSDHETEGAGAGTAATVVAVGPAAVDRVDLERDDQYEEEDDGTAATAEVVDVRAGARIPSRARRTFAAFVATVIFEALYFVAISLVAFFTAGVAALVPTLQSAVATPFAWAPALVVFLSYEVFALLFSRTRRAVRIGSLVIALVVYLGSTLIVLLLAGGTAALGVYAQELGVYPFFLTGIVAREVMLWTKVGRPDEQVAHR